MNTLNTERQSFNNEVKQQMMSTFNKINKTDIGAIQKRHRTVDRRMK